MHFFRPIEQTKTSSVRQILKLLVVDRRFNKKNQSLKLPKLIQQLAKTMN